MDKEAMQMATMPAIKHSNINILAIINKMLILKILPRYLLHFLIQIV